MYIYSKMLKYSLENWKIKDFLLSQSYFFTTQSGPRSYQGHIITAVDWEGHLYFDWLGKYINPKDAEHN